MLGKLRCENTQAAIFAAVKNLHTFQDHSAPVYCIARGKDEQHIFSASGDRFVVEWNIATFQQTGFTIRLEKPAYSVCYVQANAQLVIGDSDGGLHIVDTVARKELRYFTVHTKGVYDLVEDARQGLLYAAGGDGVLTVWNTSDWSLLRKIPLSDQKLRQLSLDRDGHRLAVARKDGYISILETAFYNELERLPGHEGGSSAVAFHPTKNALFSGGRDAHLKIWMEEKEWLSMPAHYFAIYGIAFDVEAGLFATCSRDKTWKLWSLKELTVLEKIEVKGSGHTHSVNRILRQNGCWITCGDDRSIRIWQE